MTVQEDDFPMSQVGRAGVEAHGFQLRQDHLMMASQSPVTWLKDAGAVMEAGDSLRKIGYRAIYARLDRRLAKVGLSRAGERVYRLRKRECETMEGYIAAANRRQNGDEERLEALLAVRDSMEEEERVMRRSGVLQSLRSVLGPLVESLVLVDRVLALRERCSSVGLIALFDELLNSPRNMALVVVG